jgi:hypothetical protein
MDWIDMVYQIDLPYSFEFEFDFTDPVNPRPKPPYVLGEIGTEEYPVVAVAENDIQSFWFDPLPDRISFGDEEIDVPVGPPGRIYSDVLEATAVGMGTLLATYDEPFIPGRLYITIAGADTFGYRDNLIDMPGYIEIHGLTVKDTEETERMAFTYNATRLTNKFWQEITDIKIINIGPEDATIAIASAGATMQQISDSQYVEYDTIGSRESFWEIDSHTIGVTDYAVLQHILPVAETITDEPKAILSQSVHRMWLLRDGTGRHIRFSQIADYTIERFRPYIYVLLTDGRILVYSKLAEYPDLESVRLLKQRTDGVKTVLSVDYDEGVAGDQVRLAARVSTKTKKVAFYYLEGTKPSDVGVLRYIDTDGSWLSTDRTPAERNQSRVTLETPTIDIPYRDYLMNLDEYGVYTFVLTTRYLDGTTDVDVQMVYSRSKVCLVWFDVYEVDPSIDTPIAICFDYNQRLWLGTGLVTTSSTTTTSTTTSSSTTSTTSSTATASTSSSTSTTTTEPFACTGLVLADDMDFLNPANWTLVDGSGLTSFVGGAWKLVTPTPASGARLRSWMGIPFTLAGDFDLCVGFQVDTATYAPGSWTYTPRAFFYMIDTGGNNVYIEVRIEDPAEPNPGQLYYLGYDNSPTFVKWYNPPAGIGSATNHVFRFTKVGSVITLFAWNPILSQWEWDGNPAGLIFPQSYFVNVNRISINHFTAGDANNLILGGWDFFYVNTGTIV